MSEFPFADTDNLQDIQERSTWYSMFFFTIFTCPRTFTHLLPLCIWDDYLIFSIAVHVITTLLLNNTIAPIETRIWSNVNFVLLVVFMSDFITGNLYRQAVDLKSHRLINRASQPRAVRHFFRHIFRHIFRHSCLKIMKNSDNLNALHLG